MREIVCVYLCGGVQGDEKQPQSAKYVPVSGVIAIPKNPPLPRDCSLSGHFTHAFLRVDYLLYSICQIRKDPSLPGSYSVRPSGGLSPRLLPMMS